MRKKFVSAPIYPAKYLSVFLVLSAWIFETHDSVHLYDDASNEGDIDLYGFYWRAFAKFLC